jgi:hypothetical protein
MGWLVSYEQLPRGMKALEYLKQNALKWSGTENPPQVVASAQVGNVCYFAVKFPNPSAADYYKVDADGSIVACLVFLTSNKRDGFGYKDMDETMGPCEASAPLWLLNKLTPLKEFPEGYDGPGKYAANWRERCRLNGELQKVRNKLKEGMKITLTEPLRFTDGAVLDKFEIVSYLRRGKKRKAYKSLVNGGLYRVSARALNNAIVEK